jgi:hypothetical protein
MHYNTTNLSGQDLAREYNKSMSQEEVIMTFFQTHKGNYTPCEVQRLANINAPITSIRRAITDLTTKRRLRKTRNQRIGMYGKLAYAWELP